MTPSGRYPSIHNVGRQFYNTNNPVPSTNEWHGGRGKKLGSVVGTVIDLRDVWPCTWLNKSIIKRYFEKIGEIGY